ncbi:hypothetical protein CYMTET_6681 [Cymbomonas tetramitiformis]|uniref:Uncharacterized protein n=1 Tax=Cymbomonas tetramitiformis TaxID=36881 RepID=A0AAE0GWZ5_9CHLO|nr:hypothetical protein CYMTET_6681 [Cymbomonas tetramitiformis]
MADEATSSSARMPDCTQFRCALDISRTLHGVSFGEFVYRAAQLIAFARRGEQRESRRQPSEALSIFAKNDAAHKAATDFLQRASVRSGIPELSESDEIEGAIDMLDAYVATQADVSEMQLASQHRVRGVHYLPLRVSRRLGRNPRRWFEFLSSVYARKLFHEQYDACSATAVHLVPLVQAVAVASSRRFPHVNTFLLIKTWVEDAQGKIQRHARAVLQWLCAQPSGSHSVAQQEPPADIDRVVDELKHAFERANYETGKRFLTVERIDARFYSSTRSRNAWRDDDALCEYVSVCDAYFKDERVRLDGTVEPRSKANILQGIKRFALRDSIATAFPTGDGSREAGEHDRNSADLLTLLRSRAITDRLASRVLQQRLRLVESAHKIRSAEVGQPDKKRSRVSFVTSEAQRDSWGWCSAQLVGHHTSAVIDESFVPLTASLRQLSVRTLLERPIITDSHGDKSASALRYLSFVCSVRLNEPHRRVELACRLYGVVCVPGDVPNEDLKGGRVFPGKVVCGVIGTAHQLRNEDPELNGTAHEWHERSECVSPTHFPFYLDSGSRPLVRFGDLRRRCCWIPHTGFWKLLAVKPVYLENCDLSAIRRSTDIELLETDDLESKETAPLGYVMGSNTEDTLHALPQRVRCAISNSLSELHSRKRVDALDRVVDRFPDTGYGYATTVCAVELLESLDFALCAHMVQQLLGVRLSVVREDGVHVDGGRMNVALGSAFTIKRDAWVDNLTLVRRVDGYRDLDDTFLHVSLFHAARLALSPSKRPRSALVEAADERRRETEYHALRRAEEKGVTLETNWHAEVERHDAARVSCGRTSFLSRNPRSVADSAWIFARCYVYPCSALMCPNVESLSDVETIKLSQGREGRIHFATNGMSLRWKCDRGPDETVQVETFVHSVEARMERTRVEIDGEDVQQPSKSHLDLYECEERGKYFERVHAHEKVHEDAVERCWRLLRIDVGSMIRVTTSCLCVQLILVP